MQEYPGLLIAAARSRLKQVVLAQVGPHGLTPHQFWTLMAVKETPGQSQAELGERVRADAPSMSRTVATLLERRLLRSETDPGDRRRSRLFLAPKGEKLMARLSTVAREVRAAVVEGMDEADLAALRRSLRHILANLDRYEERVRRRET